MYWQLFCMFFKVGLFTIGGGMAMVPLLQEKICVEKEWLTEEEMIDCLAICQGLPGVVAVNMATYVGNKMKGIPGSFVCTLGMILPSFICIILVVSFLNSIQANVYVQGALKGLRIAATGLIAYATWSLGKQILKGQTAFHWMLALSTFVGMSFFGVNGVWIIIGSMILGIFYEKIRRIKMEKNSNGRMRL